MDLIKVKFKEKFAGSTDGITIQRYKKDEVADVSVAFSDIYCPRYCEPVEAEESKEDKNQVTMDDLLGSSDNDEKDGDLVSVNIDVDREGNSIDRSVWLKDEDVDEEEGENPVDELTEDSLRVKSIVELKAMCKERKITGYSKKNEDDLIDMILSHKEG